MRGKLCPARELPGPSMAQSMQPGGGQDAEEEDYGDDDDDGDGDDDDDEDDGDDGQSDLFS